MKKIHGYFLTAKSLTLRESIICPALHCEKATKFEKVSLAFFEITK